MLKEKNSTLLEYKFININNKSNVLEELEKIIYHTENIISNLTEFIESFEVFFYSETKELENNNYANENNFFTVSGSFETYCAGLDFEGRSEKLEDYLDLTYPVTEYYRYREKYSISSKRTRQYLR